MSEVDNARSVVDDLFYEQDSHLLGSAYRHGVMRTVAVLTRSLLLRRSELMAIDVASGASIAVVFFPNEYEAIKRATTSPLRVDRILRIDMHSLGFVRKTLGGPRMLREILQFAKMAWRVRGGSCIGRLAYPLLGWLIQRTFEIHLAGKSEVTVITANMVHPLSVGVARAATLTGQRNIYYEHATTTRLVFYDRGYSEFFVQFPHTGRMLIDMGVSASRVFVVNSFAIAPVQQHGPIAIAGICINDLDTLESINDVTMVLKEKGLSIVYRVHDADARLKQFIKLAKLRGVLLSDARQSRIETFLDTVDLIVAGNSNVVADALLARCPVIYYWAGSSKIFDYYGLVTHYSLPNAHDQETLRAAIDGIQSNANVV